MKSHTYAALAEAVEVGLYRGWDQTHRDHAVASLLFILALEREE